MSAKTATIFGATGLIGSHLLQLLKEDGYFEKIRLILRLPYAGDQKVEVRVINFENESEFESSIAGSDVVFCAVGTTQRKVKGDQQAYRKVDYDIPVHAAQFCKKTNCNSFVVVSAIGANSRSKNFYLKLKGEMEDALRAISLKSVHVMHPSLLLGSRNEFRLGEIIAKGFMQTFSFLFLGGISKYKPIHAKRVAAAMVAAAKLNKEGFFIYEYEEMRKVSGER
jgi:uncharacterized protein YbjT (DUF2867 family)